MPAAGSFILENATEGSSVVPSHSGRRIHDLPHELLALVFEAAAHATLQDGETQPFALLASHVCAHWHAVARSSANVWRNLPVHPGKDDLTRFYLACGDSDSNTRDQVLRVCILADRGLKGLNATMQLILPTAARWGELYVRADGAPSVYLVFSHLRSVEANMTRLRHFQLRVAGPQTAIGWLPPIFENSDGARRRLKSVALYGMSFKFRSPALCKLESLTLAYLPREMSAPTFADFREVVLMSPRLAHLKLAGVFPQLSEHMAGLELLMPQLRTLELVMKQDTAYVPLFFEVVSAPQLEELAFESPWRATWEGFEAAVALMDEKFERLRVLHLTLADAFEFEDQGTTVDLFGAFPLLREFSLNVMADDQALYFLRTWITALGAGSNSDPFANAEDGSTCFGVWPYLELITIRAPYDDIWSSSINESLDLLGSIRLSLSQPFDIWKESIFSYYTIDSLDTP